MSSWTPVPELLAPLRARGGGGAARASRALHELRDQHVRRFDPVLRSLAAFRPGAADGRAATTPGAIAVKDLVDVVGFTTRCGSPWFRRHPHESAPLVTLVEPAGVVIGKAETTEFGAGTAVPSRNPHFPWLTPGGSSSGSAVAVAAGFCDLAVGTDTIASVRHPAACCGVVGLRLTPVPALRAGVMPLSPSLDTVGLMARRASDLAWLWSELDGLRAALGSSGPVPPRRWLVVEDWWTEDVDPAVAAVWDDFCARLSGGRRIVRTTLPWWWSRPLAWPLFLREFGDVHRRPPDAPEEAYGGSVAPLFELAAAISDREYHALLRDCERAQAQAEAHLGEADVVVLPLDPRPPRPLRVPLPEHVAAAPGAAAATDAAGAPAVGFAEIAALAGLPALALPVGTTVDGAPVAVQLLARRGADSLLVAAAEELEHDVIGEPAWWLAGQEHAGSAR